MALWYHHALQKAATKHPKAIVVDFDGTIARDAYPDIGALMPGVKEALQKIKDAGYEIIVFTARFRKNDGRSDDEISRQKEKVAKWIEDHDLPITRLDDGYDGKPHGDFYIDNKALHYGGDNDWESIARQVLEGK